MKAKFSPTKNWQSHLGSHQLTIELPGDHARQDQPVGPYDYAAENPASEWFQKAFGPNGRSPLRVSDPFHPH